MTREACMHKIETKKIIAIARGVDPSKAVALAEALYAGGVELLEFPFDMKNPESTKADESIAAVVAHMGDKMCVGCGTASSIAFVERAHAAGAQFIISADANPEVIKRTRALGLVSMPGVATGTELMQAYRAGADYAKLFPAGALGLDYLKALKGPFSHVKYIGVGGINLKNVGAFIKAGCVGVGIGGSLMDMEAIEQEAFEKITEAAKSYVKAVEEVQ